MPDRFSAFWHRENQDKADDIRTLVESFTAPALAAALRDRETALHACAHLLEKVRKERVVIVYGVCLGGAQPIFPSPLYLSIIR